MGDDGGGGLIHRVESGSERGSLTKESRYEYWYQRARLYRRFYDNTAAMRQEVDRWLAHLLEAVAGGRSGGRVTNKAGMTKGVGGVPEDPVERQHVASELAAFMLQGAEAAVIHSLASLREGYGFSPVANEHDGLVTLGPVPKEAVKEAAEMAKVDPSAATLEEKPFG